MKPTSGLSPKGNEAGWDNRGHFFAAAAEAMRRILVESARRKQRLKHGGGLVRATEVEDVASPERTVRDGITPVIAGTVTFKEGATILASGVALGAGGPAGFNTSNLSAGMHIITATYSGANGYDVSAGNFSISAAKAHLTVTANSFIKIVGAANPTLTASITGFVNGESLAASGVTGIATLSTLANAASPVGSYAIDVSQGTLSADNYDFTNLISGTLQVTYAIVCGPLEAHQSGSTIPIKLQLNDAFGINLSSANTRVTALGIASIAAPDTILPSPSPGNSNPDGIFNMAGNSYHFNLKTDGLISGVYYFYFLADGDPVRHSVQFAIR